MTVVCETGNLAYVIVDGPPEDHYGGYDGGHAVEETHVLKPEYAGLPPRLREALEEVCADFDNRACAGFGCENSVGYVLNDDDDSPHRGVEWRYTTVLDNGKRTWALCEDCTTIVLPADDAPDPAQPALTLIPGDPT